MPLSAKQISHTNDVCLIRKGGSCCVLLAACWTDPLSSATKKSLASLDSKPELNRITPRASCARINSVDNLPTCQTSWTRSECCTVTYICPTSGHSRCRCLLSRHTVKTLTCRQHMPAQQHNKTVFSCQGGMRHSATEF